MKRFVAVMILALAATRPAAEKITELTLDGRVYHGIFDVHQAADGRVTILYHVGGMTMDAGELPRDFLKSWDVEGAGAPTPPATAAADGQSSADFLRYQQARALAAAADGGLIREIDHKRYDLRSPPAGWEQIVDAKLVSFNESGALLDLAPSMSRSNYVFVRNLPMVSNATDLVTAWVKHVGFERVIFGRGTTLTISSYDYGRVCTREEVSTDAVARETPEKPPDHWHEQKSDLLDLPELRDVHSTGTGFFISPDGWLVTSFHVVAKAAKVRVRHGAEVLTASVMQTDQGNDIALLKVDGGVFPWLSIDRTPVVALGEPVFTIGYPDPPLQGLEPKYSEGILSSLDGFRDDPREYQTSVSIQPGNSGGPLVDGQGRVVGIIRAELSPKAALESSGALPQNVNYAVKAEFALPLWQTANPGRDFPRFNPVAPGAGAQEVRERARGAVVMIMVY